MKKALIKVRDQFVSWCKTHIPNTNIKQLVEGDEVVLQAVIQMFLNENNVEIHRIEDMWVVIAINEVLVPPLLLNNILVFDFPADLTISKVTSFSQALTDGLIYLKLCKDEHNTN